MAHECTQRESLFAHCADDPLRLVVLGWFALAAVVLVCGCSTSRQLERLDTEARGYLQRARSEQFPELSPTRFDLDPHRDAGQEPYASALTVDLRTALALAARHSRDYQTAREHLYSSALVLCREANAWDWNVTNSLGGLLARDLDRGETRLGADARLGLSRRLLSGGRLSLVLAVDSLRYLTGDRDVDIGSLAVLTLTQPLLSGAGELTARESLTQAERNLVYSLRSFERTRKSLLIDVAERYYAVLSAADSLEIARRNYQNLQASRERSELMGDAGRVPPFQIDQARQDELTAHASVIAREQTFQSAMDRLKGALGLSPSALIEVDREELTRLGQTALPFPSMGFEQASATGLANRLDYATTRDELADAERAVRIARDTLKPKLDVALSARASSPRGAKLRAMRLDQGIYSAGLDAELPLDRTNELVSYRLALIARDRQERRVAAKRDQIINDLRTNWRNLESAEQNYRIQVRSVELAEKRVESTELLFQAGRVMMRDILDARNSLIQARNSRTQALVTHRLSWLRFLFDLEQLNTDPDSLWSAGLDPPAVPTAQ